MTQAKRRAAANAAGKAEPRPALPSTEQKPQVNGSRSANSVSHRAHVKGGRRAKDGQDYQESLPPRLRVTGTKAAQDSSEYPSDLPSPKLITK